MRSMILSALAVLLLAGEAGAQSRQPPQQDAAKSSIEDRRNDQSAAGENAGVAALVRPENDEQPAGGDGDQTDEDITSAFVNRITADPLMALLTGGLLIAAFCQVWISWLVAVKQMRAYCRVDIEKVDGVGTENPVEVVLKVVNTGQTPAYDVLTLSWCDIRPFPHPAMGFEFVGPINESVPISKTIVQGGDGRRFKTGSDRALTLEETVVLSAGDVTRFYVYGSVSYRDTFGFRRYTNFCFALRLAAGEKTDTAYCHLHNEAT